MKASKVFDQWPERYDQWFQTPIGKLIKTYEMELILEMLKPSKGDLILDAGCGTGVFTKDFIFAGAKIVGLDLSFPMLVRAGEKLSGSRFLMTQGDMEILPFADHIFDKTVSVTAIEFIKDARDAVDELFRVTKPGGLIVVATLNSLSPWAERRKISGEKGHSIFQEVVFRSPEEMRNLSKVKGIQKSAIYFQKEEIPERAKQKGGDRRFSRPRYWGVSGILLEEASTWPTILIMGWLSVQGRLWAARELAPVKYAALSQVNCTGQACEAGKRDADRKVSFRKSKGDREKEKGK